jgi:putative sterol carrier protein
MHNSYFTLRKLRAPIERDLGATFQRMAELLERSEEPARVQFRILDGEKQLYWWLELGSTACRSHAEKDERPDFEIITKAETWWQIAEGLLAPLRAFTQGKMRVRGDIELGKRILQRLASPEC